MICKLSYVHILNKLLIFLICVHCKLYFDGLWIRMISPLSTIHTYIYVCKRTVTKTHVQQQTPIRKFFFIKKKFQKNILIWIADLILKFIPEILNIKYNILNIKYNNSFLSFSLFCPQWSFAPEVNVSKFSTNNAI